MTATPNPVPPVKTGCIAVTIPDGVTDNLGTLSINDIKLDSVTNTLCFLDMDIVITFSGYPGDLINPEIQINLTTGDYTYWENGNLSNTLSITGLFFDPTKRSLSFGTTSKWVNS